MEQIGDVGLLINYYMEEKLNNHIITAWLTIKNFFIKKVDLQLCKLSTHNRGD